MGGAIAQRRWALLREAIASRRPPSRPLPAGDDGVASGLPEAVAAALDASADAVQGGRADDLAGLLRTAADDGDRTGVVAVWPAERALAVWAAGRPDDFAGRRVVEIGAGRAGLAGLAVAASSPAAAVWLTDGHVAAVDALRAGLDAIDRGALRCTDVSAARMRWGSQPERGESAHARTLLTPAFAIIDLTSVARDTRRSGRTLRRRALLRLRVRGRAR